jgi:hypothetical protein
MPVLHHLWQADPQSGHNSTGDTPGAPGLSRRSVLGVLGGALLATVPTRPSAGQEEDDDGWTVVALPDTQFYVTSDELSSYVTDQVNWIVDNLDSESIRFVTHEGDLVDDGSSEREWGRIDAAMSPLHGAVPYATVPGNHDWAVTNDKSSSASNYTDYFGPSRFDDRSWYGGTGPRSGGLNSYQLFSAGGYDFLHVGLEWEPSGTASDASTPLGWAQSVLDEHSERPTLLTTHSYLRDDGGRATSAQDASGDGNAGEDVWRDLVGPNPQVFVVLNGHWHETDGENRQVSSNSAGLPVYEVAADYQDRANGGNGWLRLLKFLPGEGEDAPDQIRVRTYSPSLDEYETDGDSDFSFDLDFERRLSRPFGGSERTSFQQGSDGYAGTVDTNLREADPDQRFDTAETVTVDTRDPQSSTDRAQALVRFERVVGGGDRQVPTGAAVETATLTVETVNEGDGGAAHRLLTDWNSDDTWASLDGGIRPDGEEATETPETETGEVSTGTTPIDVTRSVQRWVDGEPNYGWAVLPLGADGWDFETSSGVTPPQLTVYYDSPIDGDADGDGDVDADDVERMQRHVANEDVDIDTGAADVDDDGTVTIGDVVAVDDRTEEES